MAARMSPRTLRRRSIALLILSLLGYYASARVRAYVSYQGWSSPKYSLTLFCGVVRLERDPTMVEAGSGWYWSSSLYGFGLETPWRPYHTRWGSGVIATHGVAIPLWPIPIGALCLACYSHGLVRGGRARDHGRCAACGYDLRGLGTGMCPECGTRCTIND